MATQRFQKVAALALLLLLIVPGASLAQLLQGAPDASAPAAAAPQALADQALGAALKRSGASALLGPYVRGLPLGGAAGGPGVQPMQPTLEAILRYYAQDRGLALTPPRTPDVGAPDALTTALASLAALKGQALTPDELRQAAALPPELQQALARIVLSYVQAVRMYTEAVAPLTRADALALAAGQVPQHAPDGGKIASAALLMDRAVRESTPALRKWGLLMAIEQRTRHPNLGDVTPDALLRAGSVTQDLRNMVDLASVLHGWQPVGAHFRATSRTPSEALTKLYRGLGLPVFLDDAFSFGLLDQAPAAQRQLLIVLADALLQAADALRRADAMVREDDVRRAEQLASSLDLDALKRADPQGLDTSQLSWAVDILEKSDEALQERLRGAALLAEALKQVKRLAPAAASSLLPGRVQSDSVNGPPALPPVSAGGCIIGSDPQNRIFVDCSKAAGGVGNTTLPVNIKYDVETVKLAGQDVVPNDVVIFNDVNGDGQAQENEVLLRSPAIADPANDVLFHDPYGFLIVGGQGSSRYDARYGHVNVSLKPENGTVYLERTLVTDQGPTGAQVRGIYGFTDILAGLVDRHDHPTNDTLYDGQDNGLINLTFNPANQTLAIVDLGGNDVYTEHAGGADADLMLANNSLSERFAKQFGGVFCTEIPLTPGQGIIVSFGDNSCTTSSDPDKNDRGPQNGIEIVNVPDPTGTGAVPGNVYLNGSNVSIPVRLSVVFDASGDDQYAPRFNYSLGAASHGIGILWDAEVCKAGSPSASACPAASRGDDTYVGASYSMGAANETGLGLFLDETGDDTHRGGNWSMGAGLQRGVGLAVDLEGNDAWYGGNYTMGSGGVQHAEVGSGSILPAGPAGVQSSVGNLTSMSGIGVLLDRQGDDTYDQYDRATNQGKGWPALGLLLDLGGRDTGLQTNVTVDGGSLGSYGLGVQSLTLLAAPDTSQLWNTIAAGQGGGLVLDAELPDTAALQGAATGAPADGVGMDAVEVRGNATFVNCPAWTASLLSGTLDVFGAGQGAPTRQCVDPDASGPAPAEYTVLSHQPFLLRVPGVFGLGGVASNNGREAKVNDQEHLINIDLAGDDVYTAPFAGGVVPGLADLDTGGQKPQPPSRGQPFKPAKDPDMAPLLQGGELAPFMVAIDVQGSDTWDARTGLLGGARRNVSTATLGGGFLGVGLLFDLGEASAGGASNRVRGDEVPAPCRGPHNDVYVGFNRTMGYGALYGVGALVDAGGDDCYVVLGGDAQSAAGGAGEDALALGAGRLGGIGVLLDEGGNDTYVSGNFSQGAGVLEPTYASLPRRVSVGGTPAQVEFHGEDGACAPSSGVSASLALQASVCNPALSLGAFYDARGHDDYTFGERSQGYGAHTASSNPGAGATDVQLLAGLFVDDGFENDTYRFAGNLSALPNATRDNVQRHRDNSFWCQSAPSGPLNGNLASVPLVQVPPLALDASHPLAPQVEAERAALLAALAQARGQLAAAQAAGLPVDPGVLDPLTKAVNETVASLLAAVKSVQDQVGPLVDNTTKQVTGTVDGATGTARDTLASVQEKLAMEVDAVNGALAIAHDAAVNGPNPQAQCLRVEAGPVPPSTNGVNSVTSGNLGRGFDNLDFYANVLLAASDFGQEYVRARSVLSAPAVIGLRCTRLDDGRADTGKVPCDQLNGTVRVAAKVVWAPLSLVVNAELLFLHVCAKYAPAADCAGLLFSNGGTGNALCQGVLPAPPPNPTGGIIPDEDWNKDLSCANYATVLGLVGLDLNALNQALAQNIVLSASSGPLGNLVRCLEFAVVPAGTPDPPPSDSPHACGDRIGNETPLGMMDRRAGVACSLTNNDPAQFVEPCAGNVSVPDSNGDNFLRWNTAQLATSPDSTHPFLVTPDGAYTVRVRAYLQPDGVGSVRTSAAGNDVAVGVPLSSDDQRNVLNRLGDEYGFYPGSATLPVVVDNPPVVYALTYHDVSRAPGRAQCMEPWEDGNLTGNPNVTLLPPGTGANRCLALHILASPPLRLANATGVDVGDPPYQVRARVLRAGSPNLTLAATPDAGLACPVGNGTQPSSDGRFLGTTCVRVPACPPGGGQACDPAGPVVDIVAGFSESALGRLTNGRYQLLADVAEPWGNATLPDGSRSNGTLRCFVAHGGPLRESTPDPQHDAAANVTTPFACSAPLAVDSVVPNALASFSPSRTAADGTHYVNLSVAYPVLVDKPPAEGDCPFPDRVGVHLLSKTESATVPCIVRITGDATLPLAFNVTNADAKASPVVAYRVAYAQADAAHRGKPREACFAPPGLDAPRQLPGLLGAEPVPCQPLPGSLVVPRCDNTRGVTTLCLNSDGHDLVSSEVQVMATDLAGNTEPFQRAGSGLSAEDRAVLDVQPPGQANDATGLPDGPVLCQQVGTGKAADPHVPRVRTANRTFPLSWDPTLLGCNGGAAETDNDAVEAVRIAFNVSQAALSLGPGNMTRSFLPGPDEQAARVANVSIDGLGLRDVLVNNRTMYAMARAVDRAGNEQLAHLCVCAHVAFDDRAPDVALLNLTVDHRSADWRWFAHDLEAGGRIGRSYLAWGAVGPDGSDNLTLVANATMVGDTALLHLAPLAQDTLYSAQVASVDDVGNARALPVLRFRTDPIANITILSPQPGDLLHGDAPLRFNVSDVRQDARLTYNVTLVEQLANGTLLEMPVENFTRTECMPPDSACPTPLDAVQVTRSVRTERFPDSAQAFLRIAVNNSLDPGQPHLVSVGPFTIDNAPPLTRLDVQAQGGPVWFRSAAVLVLQPGDNTTSVVSTEYSFDNFTFTRYNASAPPVLDTEGRVPFFFRSVDLAGNVEPLRTVVVNIDRQRPTGNLSIDLGAAATSDPDATVFIQASDALSGVANVTLDVGDGRGAQELDHPARFAAGRSIPVHLEGGQGERRVRVRVTDLAGNVEELKASILVDQVPPVISDAQVSGVEHTSATLSWRTDEPSPSRVDAGVLGAAVLPDRFEVPELARAHTLTLTGLRPSTTYAYRIVATDALGNRATQQGTLTTLPDVQPPGAPTSVRALDLGNGVTHLTWLPAFDDVGIDHYVVLRGVAGQLDELARTSDLEFFDDTALPGVAYDYAVQAVDLAGQPGPLSSVVQGRATTPPQLLDGRVTPDSGPFSGTFTYTVVVKDPDGDTPVSVHVRISGTALEMRPQFTGVADFSRGVTYALATKLPPTTLAGGFPTYQFDASDGAHVVVAPDVPVAGPAVLGLGAVLPGLSAATTLFGLPGFEAMMSVAAIAVAAGAVLLARRRRDA